MNLEEFCNKINYRFNEIELLKEALTHPSFSVKNNKNYQRLEFLGDKVLSLIIAEFLMKKYQDENEGDLSKRQAALVSGSILSEIAAKIEIDKFLILSVGEEKMGGRNNKRNLENALEALIGAIYIDGNYFEARKFIFKYWQDFLEKNQEPPKDPVSKLQEFVQNEAKKLPQYNIIQFGGNAHNPEFEAILTIENCEFRAQGKSKKEAQKNAAIKALQYFKIL